MEQQSGAHVRGADLAATLERVLRLTREMSTAGDLSSTAASVLYRLARSGPSRVTDMAHAAGVSQPSMSQLVGRLEQDGLVDRAIDGDDRRAVLVAISDPGRAVIGARRAQRAALFDEALGRLDDGDRVAIAAALPALDRLVDAVVGP